MEKIGDLKMLTIRNKNHFRRLAYVFMNVFNNIESVTLSYWNHTWKLDFWKRDTVFVQRGIFTCRQMPYWNLSLNNRNTTYLLDSIDVSVSFDSEEYQPMCVTRNEFIQLYKNPNRMFREFEAKEKLKIIAKTLNCNEIEIGENNVFEFRKPENFDKVTIKMRGAGSNIMYKGVLSYR